MIKFADLLEEEKDWLISVLIVELRKIADIVVSTCDKQKFLEFLELSEKLEKITKRAFTFEEFEDLGNLLQVMSHQRAKIFPEDYSWYRNPVRSFFDSLKKDSERLPSYYRRARPTEKIAIRLNKQFKEEFQKKDTGKHHRQCYPKPEKQEKREAKILKKFWGDILFSAIEDIKNKPSDLQYLDIIFVCIPKWIVSVATLCMIKDPTAKDFTTLVKEYLNIIEPIFPQIRDIADATLKQSILPEASDLEREIMERDAQRVKELTESASVKIPKDTDKENRRRMNAEKQKAKTALDTLKQKQKQEIQARINKVIYCMRDMELLDRRSYNYKEYLMKKSTNELLHELTGMISYFDRECGASEAKGTASSFIKQKLDHIQSARATLDEPEAVPEIEKNIET